MRIGNVIIESKLALAPMAGVTDAAFRAICREQGAGLTCTEMVSSKALMFGDKKTRALLSTDRDRSPVRDSSTAVAVQLFGSDASCMGDAAAKVCELTHPDLIDLNMGCPVGKVVKSGDGSALMLDPDKAGRIIEAVVRRSSVPVTVKFRKGFDSAHVNAVEFARMCEAAGASAVTVHGRTRTQMYAGAADWDIIRRVKEAVSIPVLASGDVFSAQDAVRILKVTGCDMAMIGRGAMGYPWLFAEATAALAGEPVPAPPPYSERVRTAVRQFELAVEEKDERSACLEARKHFAWYLKGMRDASFFKERVMNVCTLDDIYKVSELILDCLRDTERSDRLDKG